MNNAPQLFMRLTIANVLTLIIKYFTFSLCIASPLFIASLIYSSFSAVFHYTFFRSYLFMYLYMICMINCNTDYTYIQHIRTTVQIHMCFVFRCRSDRFIFLHYKAFITLHTLSISGYKCVRSVRAVFFCKLNLNCTLKYIIAFKRERSCNIYKAPLVTITARCARTDFIILIR